MLGTGVILLRQNLSTGLKSLDSDTEGNERFLSLYNHRLRIIAPKKVDITEKPVTDIPLNQAVHLPDYGISVEVKTLRERPSWTVENRQNVNTNDNPKLLPTKIGRADYIADVYLDHLIFDDDDLLKSTPITLRTRKNGDKYHQTGMDCPMRLKKFFINKRIPRFNRDFIPVLAFENNILWVQDHGFSESIRPTELYPATHRIKIKLTTTPMLDDLDEEEDEHLSRIKIPAEAMISGAVDADEIDSLMDADTREEDPDQFDLDEDDADSTPHLTESIHEDDERFHGMDVDELEDLDEEE